MRKGQAALEFLMTYGWAILVVLAAIGALAYFGVLNPSNLVPETCVPSTGWACPGKPQIVNNTITFSIVNGQGYDIRTNTSTLSFQELSTTDGGGVSCANRFIVSLGNVSAIGDGDLGNESNSFPTVRNGEGATIVLKDCTFPTTSTVKTDVVFNYTNPSSLLTETARFTINGKEK